MQTLTPTGTRNPNSHTAADILDALVGRYGSRRFTFRYELLDSTNALIRELDNVESGSVSQNWLADIKRTASFTLRDTGIIDFLSNRIKPYVRLHLAPYGEDDWVEWPQGVFLLSTPSRQADEAGVVTRDVDGYDQLEIFAEELVSTRYTVSTGTKYTDAIVALLGSVTKVVQTSALTLQSDREWEPGTSKLKIINELLNAINYNSLSFDEDGNAIVSSYTAPSDRPAEYTYADDEDSVLFPEMEQTLDLFGVANNWVLVVSDPDRDPIVGTYTNNDPGSPTSTVRRGRTITDFRTEQDAPDQTTLDALAARLAFEASQIYETVEFETGLMPIHSGNDVYQITFSRLAIDAKYSEHTWELPLKAGASMKHTARRVVNV
jgi:hypothetical protein